MVSVLESRYRDPLDQKVVKNRKLIQGFEGLYMKSSKTYANLYQAYNMSKRYFTVFWQPNYPRSNCTDTSCTLSESLLFGVRILRPTPIKLSDKSWTLNESQRGVGVSVAVLVPIPRPQFILTYKIKTNNLLVGWIGGLH